jgi:hypothetical protein
MPAQGPRGDGGHRAAIGKARKRRGARSRTQRARTEREREREMMGRCALPGIAGTRQKKENKLVERGFGGTETTSTAAADCERLKEVWNV